jgi:4-amino-4-deoxy-L-arabinose transferase-like glycosyltransferase
MKFFKNNYFKIFALVAVFIFTFILRAHNYDREPEIGQLEEMLYGWSGIHLIAEGVPISWSTLEYPESAKVYEGEISLDGSNPKHFVSLYKPWLDEPPVYSLISGGSAYLFGADRWNILPSAYIRLPQIFISFFTSIFIFLIARKVSGFWNGIISVLLYGTVPTFVFSSRLAVPENLIALIFLILIYSILRLRENSNEGIMKIALIVLLPVLIGIAGLSKPTGFLIAPLLIYELFLKKYYKSIVYTIIAVAICVAIFIGYGLYYNSAIFWNIVTIQSTRPIGFGTLGYTLTTPAYDIFLFYDTFYIFCLVSLIYYVFKFGANREEDKTGRSFLVFSGVYWLIIAIMSGGERDLLPWYRFGLFPLLPIFGVWLFKSCLQNFSFIKSVFLISLFLGNRFLLINPFRPAMEPAFVRIIFSALVLPSLGYEAFRKNFLKIIGQSIIVGVFIVGTNWNIIYTYNAHELKCERRECAIGPSTPVSRLHFPVIWRFLVLPPSLISNPKGFHFGRNYD